MSARMSEVVHLDPATHPRQHAEAWGRLMTWAGNTMVPKALPVEEQAPVYHREEWQLWLDFDLVHQDPYGGADLPGCYNDTLHHKLAEVGRIVDSLARTCYKERQLGWQQWVDNAVSHKAKAAFQYLKKDSCLPIPGDEAVASVALVTPLQKIQHRAQAWSAIWQMDMHELSADRCRLAELKCRVRGSSSVHALLVRH